MTDLSPDYNVENFIKGITVNAIIDAPGLQLYYQILIGASIIEGRLIKRRR